MSLNPDQRFRLELIIEGAKEKAEATERNGDPYPLSEWEDNFLISIEERFKKWDDGVLISAKQWAVLDRIYEKVVDL